MPRNKVPKGYIDLTPPSRGKTVEEIIQEQRLLEQEQELLQQARQGIKQERKEKILDFFESGRKKLRKRSPKTSKKLLKRQARFIQRPRIRIPQFSKEQMLLKEMFDGEPTFGTGRNLPQINRILNSGQGLINNDDYGETGRMFGLK